MSTVSEFISLCQARGSDVLYHRDSSVTECPCRTPQGFRDPIWHLQNPDEPMCNEAGMLSDEDTTTEITVKAFVQPVQARAVRSLTAEAIQGLFGEIMGDDHIGIFPESWSGTTLDFYEWGSAAEDYIVYNGRKFQVVNANLMPDPSDGNPRHHWEVGLRLVG